MYVRDYIPLIPALPFRCQLPPIDQDDDMPIALDHPPAPRYDTANRMNESVAFAATAEGQTEPPVYVPEMNVEPIEIDDLQTVSLLTTPNMYLILSSFTCRPRAQYRTLPYLNQHNRMKMRLVTTHSLLTHPLLIYP
jgi:hypothetical protein